MARNILTLQYHENVNTNKIIFFIQKLLVKRETKPSLRSLSQSGGNSNKIKELSFNHVFKGKKMHIAGTKFITGTMSMLENTEP